MKNQIKDLKDKLEQFSQKAEENDEKMKILRREMTVMEDRELKLKSRVTDNLKKKKKQTIEVDLNIKHIPEWGKKIKTLQEYHH